MQVFFNRGDFMLKKKKIEVVVEKEQEDQENKIKYREKYILLELLMMNGN